MCETQNVCRLERTVAVILIRPSQIFKFPAEALSKEAKTAVPIPAVSAIVGTQKVIEPPVMRAALIV